MPSVYLYRAHSAAPIVLWSKKFFCVITHQNFSEVNQMEFMKTKKAKTSKTIYCRKLPMELGQYELLLRKKKKKKKSRRHSRVPKQTFWAPKCLQILFYFWKYPGHSFLPTFCSLYFQRSARISINVAFSYSVNKLKTTELYSLNGQVYIFKKLL